MKKIKIMGIALIVLACLSALLLADIPTYLKIKNDQVISLNEVDKLSLEKHDVISGTADYVVSCVAEEYNTNFGIRTSSDSTKRYYVVWMDNENYIIYATANNDEYKTLDTMVDESDAFFKSLEIYSESKDYEDLVQPTTTIKIEGVVEEMPSEVREYFKEWYGEDEGINTFANECEPLMISRRDFSRYGTTILIGVILAGLFVILGVVTLILWRKEKNSNFGY